MAAWGGSVGGTRSPGWWAEFSDLVWPAVCPGCGASGAGTTPACRACLRAFQTPALPTTPTPRPAWLPPLWAVADYDGTARAVMLAHKERGSWRLTGPLGAALAAGLFQALEAATGGRSGAPPDSLAGGARGGCVVIPMPSSAAARRLRGEDPTLRITRAAVRRLRSCGVPAATVPALRQLPGTLDQAGLSATDRMRNLAGGLQLRRSALPLLTAATTLLLADDIVTTGATLAEATRELTALDLPVAGAAVVASTRRRLVPTGS